MIQPKNDNLEPDSEYLLEWYQTELDILFIQWSLPDGESELDVVEPNSLYSGQ